jgi:adenosylhomocysteine nucleosidase
MLALLGAIDQEIIGMRKKMTVKCHTIEKHCHLFEGEYNNKKIVLAKTGVGRIKAEQAIRFILKHYPVTAVISFGFCGALLETLNVGDIVASNVFKAESSLSQSGSIAPATEIGTDSPSNCMTGSCVTVGVPVTAIETRITLRKDYRCDIVDMETYWIARIVIDANLPFVSLRAVSDTGREVLPPIGKFMNTDGEYQWNKAVWHFVSHPQDVPSLLHLGKNISIAGGELNRAVDWAIGNL